MSRTVSFLELFSHATVVLTLTSLTCNCYLLPYYQDADDVCNTVYYTRHAIFLRLSSDFYSSPTALNVSRHHRRNQLFRAIPFFYYYNIPNGVTLFSITRNLNIVIAHTRIPRGKNSSVTKMRLILVSIYQKFCSSQIFTRISLYRDRSIFLHESFRILTPCFRILTHPSFSAKKRLKNVRLKILNCN